MNPLIQLQATVVAPPGLTARTHRGVEFVVREVTWAAYPFGLAVTLMDPRTGSNTSLYPPRQDVSHLPHPGEWFDHLAAEIVTPTEEVAS